MCTTSIHVQHAEFSVDVGLQFAPAGEVQCKQGARRIHDHLLDDAGDDSMAQYLRVGGCTSSSSSYQRHVVMSSCAANAQSLNDALAARQKARKHFHEFHPAILLLDLNQHPELKHMTFHEIRRRVT